MTALPSSPTRGNHVRDRSLSDRDRSLSEAVLGPQAVIEDALPVVAINGDAHQSIIDEEVSVNLTEHHEALIGAEFHNPTNIIKQPTLATLGETPFAYDGDEVEHHRIVATEIVKDPIQFASPEPILQNAIVLLDPRIPDCTHLIEAGKKRGLMIMAVVPKPNDGSKAELLTSFYPTAEALLEVGMHQVYEPPMGSKFDIVECATHLKTIESQQNLRFLGVVPCREAAVDFSDILGSLLGLTVVNDLGLSSARRDKGLMKLAVSNAGLRVAKYARLTQGDGTDVIKAVEELELEYPVVVKTPRGMSTMDVFICASEKEAVQSAAKIVRSVGPDGRKTQYALLEEFIGGEEFALNLIASPATPRGVQVTDIWHYHKINTDGTMVNTYQEMVDCHDKKYAQLVQYAEGVCRAVGIKYGMGHCELKAEWNEKRNRWVDPVMIEIAGRLAGGRKAIMAEETIPGWHPFDAMIDAHCGFPVRMPPSFSPTKKAVQTYIPSDKNGILKSVKGDNFERLPTHHESVMLVGVGDKVVRATALMSFAAFVWLIGDAEDVKRDAMAAREEFKVEVEAAEDS
mmetsp:Transcript_53489/g.113601  ORF Transcript_53489/g.113601 Transcript_53489/m.113601 type:complete len:571 (+) Transcript_53489:188-1900(+)|eukprot:CAMPEP_0172560518 /NCGR_PEP_ID=MMETSP1067-20121228/89090_1 /TAXON_ID=265564 ORGANISM="Thalassiosira punctigera, Strain Tpunct2005C2" /NCGR_SAMPLE_ID=MMETSP1067 /ASSEMBLY_ACC=CAM_ASM_000444 /LENGTH=570 /DNA_ID=CAMNT_0013350331 /DNA_START=108 /DNA_END=1820 /DNA_ORIENTATION=-